MASNSKQKKSSTLSRDLLNLALLLAFIHVDPESYLGLNNNGRNMFNEYNGQPFFRENKILDDLSALGRFNGYIPSPRSVEISAYILKTSFRLEIAFDITKFMFTLSCKTLIGKKKSTYLSHSSCDGGGG